MNIDLLITDTGEAGIVSDMMFDSPVAGVMYDNRTGTMSIEFSDMNALDLNIPLDSDIGQYIYYSNSVQVGTIQKGVIQDNREVPLLVMGMEGQSGPINKISQISNSVLAFESFLKNCVTGQPLHRDDLADEESIDGVMSSINTDVLNFAPHLARQKTMEATPNMAPKGPIPSGPSGMGGGMGGGMTGGGMQGGNNQTNGSSGHDNRRGYDDDER